MSFLKRFATLSVAVFSLFFAVGAQAEEKLEHVLVKGSSSVYSAIMHEYQDEIARDANVDLEVFSSSSGRGLRALLANETDIGMISSPLDVMVEKMAKEGRVVDASHIQPISVGNINLSWVVHPTNPVQSVTKDQIYKILNGDITNWKDINGIDMPIKVVTEHPTGGMFALVDSILFDENSTILEDKIAMQNGPQVGLVVSQLPGGFGFLSSATPQDLILGTKEIDVSDFSFEQKLFLIVNKDRMEEPKIKRTIEASLNYSVDKQPK